MFFSPFHGFWQNAESIKIHKDIDLHINGNDSPIKVVLDDRMVPHIYAQNLQDALIAQGYLHAKNRLWQMDMTCRSTMGQLSEVMGVKTLEYDKKQRRLGLPIAANNIYKEWAKDDEVIKYMDAYVLGINLYINQLDPSDYPLEYKLLDYKPTPMAPFDIAKIYVSMSNVLCSYSLDIEQSNNLSWLGRQQFDNLFPDHNPRQSSVIPSEKIWDFDPIFKDTTTEYPTEAIGSFNGQTYNPNSPSLGSNNWAISPDKSANGHAILCNDPHLKLTLPSVWYENHIVTPDQNTYGVSLPGAPGIIIGFNDYISWGTTNGSHDVMDWYDIKWTDKTKQKYYLDGEQIKTEKIIEKILVKNNPAVYDTILNTYWGPVWNKGNRDVSLKWVMHNSLKLNSFKTFIKFNTSKNYDDYKSALSTFEAPIQNLIFADKKGDIALTVQGKLPIRNNGSGSLVLDGSSTNNDWKGFIPNTHNPAILNPQQGYIASANQHSTDADYPYYYHGKFDDYRGRTINKLLAQNNKVTIQDCKEYQNNNYSILAEELLSTVLPLVDKNKLSSFEQKCFKLLSNWDYTFLAELKAPSLFVKLEKMIQLELFDEFTARQENIVYPEIWRTIEILQDDIDHPFIDNRLTATKDSKSDVCTSAFKAAVKKYTVIEDIPAWHKSKSTKINHLALIDQFSKSVNTDGHGQSLNAQTATTGPSWRMIVEMSNPIKALGVYPGGQSGNPGSLFYDNMIETWSKGEYYNLQHDRSPDKLKNKLYQININ